MPETLRHWLDEWDRETKDIPVSVEMVIGERLVRRLKILDEYVLADELPDIRRILDGLEPEIPDA
jgi:hypothetical protein